MWIAVLDPTLLSIEERTTLIAKSRIIIAQRPDDLLTTVVDRSGGASTTETWEKIVARLAKELKK